MCVYRLGVAAAAQPLDACELSEAALLEATEGQRLAHVARGVVVTREHARLQLRSDAGHVRIVAEDVGAERKVAAVGLGGWRVRVRVRVSGG